MYGGFGLWGAALAWVLAVITGLVAGIYFLQRLFPAIGRRNIQPVFEGKQLLRFSLPLSVGDFLWLVMIWTDMLLLGYFRSPAEVGVYRAASQTALLMTLFAASLNSIFAPIIADLHHRKSLQKMGQLFQSTTRWSFSASLPLFLIVAVAGQDILSFFGEAFEVGWLPLVILATGQLVRAATGAAVDMLIIEE